MNSIRMMNTGSQKNAPGGVEMVEKYDHKQIIGQEYERGMLTYGGAVDFQGRIVYAVSEEEHNLLMKRIKNP
ncbi:conserved protein of unknown function [Methanoculleus bourgensis]|jgi:hypothetical protein|uniref:Uncharacterized protein n=3 Tax=Methanoculleus bourgensis TaxID=83986 RepID=A0A0X3BNU9_9EURY|nr:conserved protein of unknown function [Methanoculleus bourgensis]